MSKRRRKPWVAAAVFAALAIGGCTTASFNSKTSVPAEPSPAIPSTEPSLGAPNDAWVPTVGVSWQWQLTGDIDTSADAEVFDVDLFDVSADTVETLRHGGANVICYFSAGAYEDWRPDAHKFPHDVLGRSNGWEGEKWLDIRQIDALGPIMAARMDLCVEKGFDAVEPDNIDGYTNSTGFDLSAGDQLEYNRFLAELAHARGLSIGLKNDLSQIVDLVTDFDFAVNEQCAQFEECAELKPFIDAGKAVFHVEYELELDEFCPITTALKFSSLLKTYELDASYETCG